MNSVERYAIITDSISLIGEFNLRVQPAKTFKPTHIRVNVKEQNTIVMSEIIAANFSILLEEVDAYHYSIDLASKLHHEFMNEIKERMKINGFINPSEDVIQMFIDDNELSAPDPGRISMPRLDPQQSIVVKGRCLKKVEEPISIQFIGIIVTYE